MPDENGDQTVSGGVTLTAGWRKIVPGSGRAYGDKDAANHDLKHVAAKAPGTYVRGNTEYWQCRDCGKYFADARAALEIKAADMPSSIPPAGARAASPAPPPLMPVSASAP